MYDSYINLSGNIYDISHFTSSSSRFVVTSVELLTLSWLSSWSGFTKAAIYHVQLERFGVADLEILNKYIAS